MNPQDAPWLPSLLAVVAAIVFAVVIVIGGLGWRDMRRAAPGTHSRRRWSWMVITILIFALCSGVLVGITWMQLAKTRHELADAQHQIEDLKRKAASRPSFLDELKQRTPAPGRPSAPTSTSTSTPAPASPPPQGARAAPRARVGAARPKSTEPTLSTGDEALRQRGGENYGQAVQQGKGWDCPVWFGTNRAPEFDQAAPGGLIGYTAERGNRLRYGKALVFVPYSHSYGQTDNETFVQSAKRLLSGGVKDTRMKQRSVVELSAADFWADFDAALEKCLVDGQGRRQALVLTHGYNVAFKDAVLRTAQLAVDLKFPGPVALFTWPSGGAMMKYTYDEASAEASEPFLLEFLEALHAREKVEVIHVIAHSMGNRIVLRTFERMRRTGAASKFGRLVLAAPDVDQDIFRYLAGQALKAQFPGGVTLYCSPKDRAVSASETLHGYSRAGLSPPVVVFDAGYTVEVAGFDVFELGHAYYAEAEKVVCDIREFLLNGTPPENREAPQAARDIKGQPMGYFQIIR